MVLGVSGTPYLALESEHLDQCCCYLRLLIVVRHCYSWGNLLLTRSYTHYTTHHNSLLLHNILYYFISLQNIFGMLNIMAISAGFCIGSCNWIVDSDHERVTYIAGSSTLTTHPRVRIKCFSIMF